MFSLAGSVAADMLAGAALDDERDPRAPTETERRRQRSNSWRRERRAETGDATASDPGIERADPDEARGHIEDRPRRSVRGRSRRNDLVARTAGIEPEPEPDEEDIETEDSQPMRSVRRRVRQRERDGELQPAPRSATYDYSDHRTITIAPGAITVQAAEDPEATAEAVAERVTEIVERDRRQRERRLRDTVIEDPSPDPEF